MSPHAVATATRITILERDTARYELELLDHEKRLQTAETSLAVIATRIGVYAAVGSCIGGAIVAGVVALILG